MVMRRGHWSTFAEDHSMTPGQLAIVAKIADESISTYKQRKDLSRKYFIALGEAVLKRGETLPETVLEEMAKIKAELTAEKNGSHVEK